MTSEEFQAQRKKKPSKYKNVRVSNADGDFDSKAEYAYWLYLCDRMSRGQIFEIQRQVSFIVIDNPKLVYKADFVFREPNEAFGLTTVICDVKGDTAPLTQTFRYKWKALKVKHPEFECRIIRAKSVKGRYTFRIEKK